MYVFQNPWAFYAKRQLNSIFYRERIWQYISRCHKHANIHTISHSYWTQRLLFWRSREHSHKINLNLREFCYTFIYVQGLNTFNMFNKSNMFILDLVLFTLITAWIIWARLKLSCQNVICLFYFYFEHFGRLNISNPLAYF